MQGLKADITHSQCSNSFHGTVLSYICKDSGSKTHVSEVSSNIFDGQSMGMAKSWDIVDRLRRI